VIAISGFLSKNTDKKDEWDRFIKYVDDQSLCSNVMALNWEAKSVGEIWKDNKDTLKSKIFSGGDASFSNEVFVWDSFKRDDGC